MLLGGLDVGRFSDRTALVGLEDGVVTEAHLMGGLAFQHQREALFPAIRAMDLVLMDVTGLGVGLYELLEQDHGDKVVPVTLGSRTGQPRILWHQDNARPRPRGVYVGKTYLIGRMLGAVNAREIKVAPWCCHRDELRHELGQLTVGYTKRGHLTTGGMKGHDDLALGLALAILARDLSSRLLRGPDAAEEEAA
jgi:hypothetical protein